jgi:TldD protein
MTDTPDPRSLLYRPGLLTPDDARRLTAAALGACDDGELYLQFIASESFGFDDGRLKTADYSRDAGFGLRGVSGEMTGFAHANEISAAAIARAGETPAARPGQGATCSRPALQQPPPLYRCLAARRRAVRSEGPPARNHRRGGPRPRPRVVQVSASLSASWSVIEIVRADGFLAQDVRPLVRLNVSIVAESNGRRETGSFGIGGRRLYDDLFQPETWNRAIDTALAQALVNLESVAAPAGEMTVLLGPGWPGVLLHEAVGHGLEGDFNRKGTSAFSGRIGQRVAAPGVTVVDDGTLSSDHGGARRGSLDRRRRHADAGKRADRGRHPQGLYAGPPQRAPDGRRTHRQRAARKLCPCADAAHDQHVHARRQRRSCRTARA